MSFTDYAVAREMRDTIKKIARRVVKQEVPTVKMGKVFSVDAARQTAWVLFPGETIENLVKVHCATDKIPTEYMETRYATDGMDAPGDLVRVWGTPGNLFVLDFYSGTPAATFRQVAGSVYLVPEQFGAVGEEGVDDAYAIQLTLSSAAAQKVGTVVYLPNQYYYKGDLLHPGGVIVHGTGLARYTVPERVEGNLVALDSTARYRYGQWGGGSSANDNPGSLHDLVINGNYVANEVFRQEGVDGLVVNCHFIRAAAGGKCAELGGSQNSTFEKVHFGYVENGRALSFDVGAGGGQSAGMIRFNDCYFATSGTLLYGDSDPDHFPPHEIIFTNCLFEDRGANNKIVDLRAGEWVFRSCIFTNSDSLAKPSNDCLVHITNATKPTWGTGAVFDSCYFNGGAGDAKPTDAIRVGTAGSVTNDVHVYGMTRVYNVTYFICFDGSNSLGSILGRVYRGVGVQWYRAINGANTFTWRNDLPTPFRWAMPDADGVLEDPIAVRRESDAQDRHWINRDGTQFWGNGADVVVRGSKGYSSTLDGMFLGGMWRFDNALVLRTLPQFVNTVDQAVTLSAAKTASPGASLVFQTNGSSAVITLNDGTTGSQFQVLLLNTGVTGNSVTWPSNVKFIGGNAPQPIDDSCVIVNLVKVGSTDWYGVSATVSNERIDDRVAALLQQGANVQLTYDDTGNALTIAVPDENIDDRVAAFLQQGTGITLTYNDVANTLTISSTGGYTDEQVDDRVAALLQQGNAITLAYNDASNTLTVSVVNATDTVPGVSRFATNAEAVAGTLTTVAVPPAGLKAALDALVDAAPGALDTLNELAAALGDDPNFATTMNNALASKQPLHAILTALSGLALSADKLIYATGANSFAITDLTSFARTLLDDANAAAARTTLGIGRYEENCPATAAGGTWTVTHNLNSQDVSVVVRRVAAPFDFVDVYIEATTVNSVAIKPDASLAVGEYRAIVKL